MIRATAAAPRRRVGRRGGRRTVRRGSSRRGGGRGLNRGQERDDRAGRVAGDGNQCVALDRDQPRAAREHESAVGHQLQAARAGDRFAGT